MFQNVCKKFCRNLKWKLCYTKKIRNLFLHTFQNIVQMCIFWDSFLAAFGGKGHLTEFRLVPNQSEKFDYNPNLFWFNHADPEKIFVCVPHYWVGSTTC